ncbi:MAG TPA: zinc ribbon domain-containing protein [Dehalococcoidia bacterium]
MPIYEYRCNGCRRTVSVFQRSMAAQAAARCPHCGGTDLTRLLSRFAVVRSQDDVLDSLDADIFADVDEDDPKSVAAWAKRMRGRLGDDLGPEFDETIERMEAGELPDGDAGDGGTAEE